MPGQRFNHKGGVGCEENFPGCNYTADECEFMLAMDRYKRSQRRPYPTWREVLRVLIALGYRKVARLDVGADPPSPSSSAEEGEGPQDNQVTG